MTANLFDQLPSNLPEELFNTLLDTGTVRIERIVSQGHASPEGFEAGRFPEHPGASEASRRMDHARRTDDLAGCVLQRLN
jgi:hypothetical protein